MRYLKPIKPKINLNNDSHELVFTLDIIDKLQDACKMPMPEIISNLLNNDTKKITVQVIIKFMTGIVIDLGDNEIDDYSTVLLSIYIDQIKSKKLQGIVQQEIPDGEYKFVDVEYWFYVGTVVLNKSDERVWEMTLGEIKTLYNEHAKYSGWLKEEKEQSLLNI
jgi:hypothetical protein